MTDRLDSSNPRTAIEFLWHKNYNVGSLTRLEYRLTVLAESWKQSGVLLPGRVRFAEIRKEQTSPSRASLQENRGDSTEASIGAYLLKSDIFFENPRGYSPGDLASLVTKFAMRAVRHVFKPFLKHSMNRVGEAGMESYIKILTDFNDQISDDVSCRIIFILKFPLMVSLYRTV